MNMLFAEAFQDLKSERGSVVFTMASSSRSKGRVHTDDESVEEVPLTANFRPPVPCLKVLKVSAHIS